MAKWALQVASLLPIIENPDNRQIYTARFEEERWKTYPISDWAYRWDFGGGAIVFETSLRPGPLDAPPPQAPPIGSLKQHVQ